MPYIEDAAKPATTPTASDTSGSDSLINSTVRVCPVSVNAKYPDYGRTAMTMYSAGSIPIPLRPRSDRPAVGCDRWIEELSPDVIQQYWREHPNHGLGALLGPLAPAI
jgi:hypothetical protein